MLRNLGESQSCSGHAPRKPSDPKSTTAGSSEVRPVQWVHGPESMCRIGFHFFVTTALAPIAATSAPVVVTGALQVVIDEHPVLVVAMACFAGMADAQLEVLDH